MGVDLPHVADVMVSEILSSEFLGEGVLQSIEDAKRRLLRAGGQIIPAGGSIMIALFGGDKIGKNVIVNEVNGFDLRAFNSIIAKKIGLRANDFDVELLSDDVEAFNFDFAQNDYFPPERKIMKIPIKSEGRCFGIIQWNRLNMNDEITFKNHPTVDSPASAWTNVLYVFDEAIDVEPGQTAVILAQHNRETPWFTLKGIEEA